MKKIFLFLVVILLSFGCEENVKPQCDISQSGEYVLNKSIFMLFSKTDIFQTDNYPGHYIIFSCTGVKKGDFVVGLTDLYATSRHFGRNIYYFDQIEESSYNIYRYKSLSADEVVNRIQDRQQNDWLILRYNYTRNGLSSNQVYLYSPQIDKYIKITQELSYNGECTNEDISTPFDSLDEIFMIENFSVDNKSNEIHFNFKEINCESKKSSITPKHYIQKEIGFYEKNNFDKKDISSPKKDFLMNIKQ